MSHLVETADLEQLLKGIKIPPQPQILVDVYIEMAQVDVSLERIADIISKDVGLSGSILKVVNSPIFGLRRPITFVGEALKLLGISNIVNVINSLSIRSSLIETAWGDMTCFWDNAADVAAVSAGLARLLNIAPQDEAYALGLFHNVGIPLLIDRFHHYPEVIKLAYAEPRVRITDIENSAIDCNHSVVGYYVAKSWHLPAYLCEAIADHHKTEQFFIDEFPCDNRKKNLLAVLKLAESTCKAYATLGRAVRDYEFERIQDSIFHFLGVSEYDYKDVQAEILEML